MFCFSFFLLNSLAYIQQTGFSINNIDRPINIFALLLVRLSRADS